MRSKYAELATGYLMKNAEIITIFNYQFREFDRFTSFIVNTHEKIAFLEKMTLLEHLKPKQI